MRRSHLPLVLGVIVLSGCSPDDRLPAQPASRPSVVAPRPVAVQQTPASEPGARVPFATREAESAATTGQVVVMDQPVAGPASEASGYGYVELAKTGEQVEFVVPADVDGLVLRHCIPDAPQGGGITATLGLYVNGQRRQSLTLSSRHNWLYGSGKPGENGQSETPTPHPHVFWDETRARIDGGVHAGDRLRLQRDAGDDASFYRIDLVDLERVPAPLPPPEGALTVTAFEADGTDEQSDTAAFLACIAAAKAQGRPLFIPPGTFRIDAGLPVDGIAISGAGMWHTSIAFTTVPERWTGVFQLGGTGPSVRDLAISGPLTRRHGPLHGFTGLARQWTVERVWIEHTNTAFWMAGDDGVVRGCRVRFTYADGININNGSAAYAHRVLVEDNHVRGCGDDGIAILCHEPKPGQRREDRETVAVTVRHNTSVMPWWASCCDLAGGRDHVIEDNLFAGNGLVVNLPAAYPMQPQEASVIRRNLIVRGGCDYTGQRRGALWIYAGATTITGLEVSDNRIVQPLFKGVDMQGGNEQRIVFARNRIEEPGQDAIVIGPQVRGEARFDANQVTGLPPGGRSLSVQATSFHAEAEGNSWQ